MISNHPVAGSMKQVIANNCNSLTLVEPSSCLTLALTVQVPIRSHHILCAMVPTSLPLWAQGFHTRLNVS